MKHAMDAFKEYLQAKQIYFEASRPDILWFSLLIPTPDCREMPARIVSCSAGVSSPGSKTLTLSATLFTVELSDELLTPVTSFFMRYQSRSMKAGRILVHPDGSVFYQITQFLGKDGQSDTHAVSHMVTAAVLEIAAIFLVKNDVIKLLPTPNVSRFGLA